jgi:tetratricopeptide (TPR) repeat protein
MDDTGDSRFEELVRRGVRLIELRRPAEALASYDAALALRPDSAHVLYNRGTVLQSLGRHAEALASYERLLSLQPGDVEALNNLGVCLLEAGRPAEALSAFERALAARPAYPDALNNRGNALQQLDRPNEALASYGKALVLRPDHPQTLNNRGNALRALGRNEEALASFDRALALRPDSSDALRNRGMVLAAMGREPEALQCYDRALALRPGDGRLLHARGRVLDAMGRHDEALEGYNAALEAGSNAETRSHRDVAARRLALPAEAQLALEAWGKGSADEAERLCRTFLEKTPDHLDVLLLLAAIRHEQDALASAERALRPDYSEALHSRAAASALRQDDAAQPRASSPEALCLRGHALDALGRLEEALDSYQSALALRPDDPEALVNLGNVLCQLGRIDDAIAAYERAQALRPGDAEAHFNSSFAYLARGDYERGWKEYEWRWQALHTRLPSLTAGRPPWLGEDEIAGKTVIVYCEQGFGDAIQMARYVPLLAARGAEVAIACAPVLEELLRTVAGVRTVFSSREPPLAFDCHIPIMSLPRAFNTTLASIPSQVPYLRAAAPAVEAWRARLASLGAGSRIGLAWAGNPRHRRDRARSIPAGLLAPLLAAPDCSFFSLQKGEAGAALASLDPRGERIVDYTAQLDSFARTAALICALDLVISADTAVAHLAGALGKPVWVMLPFAPDARWMRDRPDSPWYPTARLFRQQQRGDWKPVIERVASELERLRKGPRE